MLMSISEAVQLVINASYMNKKKFRTCSKCGKQIFICEITKRIIRLMAKQSKIK